VVFFHLSLSVLPRQPRAPAFQVDINGHRGIYYVDPRLHYFMGDEEDEYNPIHAGAQRRIALPAPIFARGESVGADLPG